MTEKDPASGTDPEDKGNSGPTTTGSLRAQRAQSSSGWFRKRDWGHIRGTRVRTSTAVLVIAFIALLWVYGYTSQRYGVVDQTTQQPAPRTTQQTYETTRSSTPSSSSVTSTSVSGTQESSQTPYGEPAPVPSLTTTTTSIPGIPFQIPVPGLNGTTQTTSPAR
ncbi:hypothetical protein [Gordonia sp. NPDC003585]|uniref:hypothetical protein n=1 Tax=Gordonia sp. NPDC003585 TaxID=3154275 RepID=UPI0033B6FE07